MPAIAPIIAVAVPLTIAGFAYARGQTAQIPPVLSSVARNALVEVCQRNPSLPPARIAAEAGRILYPTLTWPARPFADEGHKAVQKQLEAWAIATQQMAFDGGYASICDYVNAGGIVPDVPTPGSPPSNNGPGLPLIPIPIPVDPGGGPTDPGIEDPGVITPTPLPPVTPTPLVPIPVDPQPVDEWEAIEVATFPTPGFRYDVGSNPDLAGQGLIEFAKRAYGFTNSNSSAGQRLNAARYVNDHPLNRARAKYAACSSAFGCQQFGEEIVSFTPPNSIYAPPAPIGGF